MLTELSFKNFKAWKDTGPIKLAPITVFFGSNSAGKTSVPQLLLMLKQTAESSDRQRVLHLGDEKSPVDLGTYQDVIHDHDVSRPLEFDLTWTLAEGLEVSDQSAKRPIDVRRLRFSAKIVSDKRQQPSVEHFSYTLNPGATDEAVVSYKRQAATSKFNLTATNLELTRQQGRAWPPPEPVRFYGFPAEVTAYFQNAAFTSDLVLQFETLMDRMYYVGPLREYPRRLYLWSGELPDHVGVRGDRAIEAILAAGDRHFNWIAKQKTKRLDVLVADRLKSMGLISHFDVRQLAEGRKEYEVLLTTREGQPQVKITDVGFGVSQVLPVIVESFYVPRGSVVIFEQPEIHLHPKVQGDLANLFVDAVRAREDAKERNCQFIIESHSEHFLRRLQTLIAKEEISAGSVALYFVKSDNLGTRIEALDVDTYGNIRNWPDGFFGDEMADLVARSEAQARRTKKTRDSAAAAS